MHGGIGWMIVVAFAQSTAPIALRDAVRCAQCAIVLDSGTVIRSAPGPAQLTGGSRFATTHLGGFVAAETQSGDQLVEFSAEGVPLKVLSLRLPTSPSGRGMPQSVAVAPDGSIHAVDAFYSRLNVHTRRVAARSMPFEAPAPQAHAVIAFHENLSVVQAMVPGRMRGAAFHVLDGSGSIKRSFGDGTNVTFLEGFGATRRRIARSAGGTFWSVSPTRYELTQWDTLGAVTARLRVESSWFVEWDERAGLPDLRFAKWPTVIQGIAVDSLGLIWIVGWTPRADWKPYARATTRDIDGPRGLSRAEIERAISAVVEVVDPVCGVVVQRARLPLALAGFLPGALDAPVSVIPDFDHTTGARSFRIVRFSLTGHAEIRSVRSSCVRGSRP